MALSTSPLKLKNHQIQSRIIRKPRRRGSVIQTTLGDLIVAVTDEVSRFVREPSIRHLVVSYIVKDVLTRYKLRDLYSPKSTAQHRLASAFH
jgi:hypothetical protein